MSLQIYQPETLRPIKGESIRTLDGDYTVQTNGEIWYSKSLYMQRVAEALGLKTLTLAQ